MNGPRIVIGARQFRFMHQRGWATGSSSDYSASRGLNLTMPCSVLLGPLTEG